MEDTDLSADQRVRQIEREKLEFLAKQQDRHHSPPLVLGSRRTYLMCKFFVVMYVFFLEVFSTMASLPVFTKEMVTGAFDFGTEFGLGTVPPFRIRTLFPWLRRRAQYDEHDDEMLSDQEQRERQLQDNPRVSLRAMLQAPGGLRVARNAGQGFLDYMAALGRSR